MFPELTVIKNLMQVLFARFQALRAHQLAEAETADQAASERMSLPVVVLFAGFLFFIGFPAVEGVLHSL